MSEGVLVDLKIKRWRARKKLTLTELGVYPTGVISNTAANPAANAYGAGSPAAVVATTSNILGGAGNTTGDLLKSWPTSSDYARVDKRRSAVPLDPGLVLV